MMKPDCEEHWFGGYAKHHIVRALHHGSESDYAKGEQIAKDIYAPVIESTA